MSGNTFLSNLPSSGKKWLIILLGVGVWLFLLSFSVQLIRAGNQLKQNARRLPQAQNDPALLVNGDEGTDLMLSGVLTGNVDAREGMLDSYARDHNMVIYAIETWDVYESDDEWHGVWRRERPVFPEQVSLNGQDIKIQCAQECNLTSAEPPVTTQVLLSGRSNYSHDGINEGSQRLVGYPDGAQVTLFGKRGAGPVLIVEGIANSAQEFQDLARFNYSFQLVVGYGFLGIIAVIALLFVIWLIIRPRKVVLIDARRFP